jgi:transcriptional regulator with GAF, ATPase, and Fis domain
MPAKTPPKNNKVKTKSLPQKPALKTDADNIRALEEQLAQRDAEIARLSTETQYLIKETEQRNTELTMLNIVQQALSSNLDFKAIYGAVGRKLIDIFKVQSASIYTIDLDTMIITYEYSFEPNSEREIGQRPVTKFHNHAINQIVASKKSYVINSGFDEFIKQFPDSGSTRRINPKSLCVAPILFQKNMLMAVSLHNIETENFFTDSSVRLLETISNATGVALENARLFDETQHLLKETDQRATELQIINNIGQTLSEGLDLDSTLERVGERLREALQLKTIGVIANDAKTGLVISHYLYLKGKRVVPGRFSFGKNMFGMRFAARVGGGPLVVNTNVEKNWRKFIANVPEWAEIPEAFVIVPLLAGRELVGSITIADYENVNAFVNLPLNLLETIASNMGTSIQNVRLFDETQRLLKETEQRATELQIINNIGQILTEGLDLTSAIERVGKRLRDALQLENIAITIANVDEDQVIAQYFYSNRKSFAADRFSKEKFNRSMRLSMRGSGRSWVVNNNTENSWRKFASTIDELDIPKSFIMLPLMAGKVPIGGITIADYEKENAFSYVSVSMLETIASNMGTAIQNVRLFDETQRLLKETEQRATELQIINNIGQTLTEGLVLQSTIEHVGERLREILKIHSIAIAVSDPENDFVLAQYIYHNGERVAPNQDTAENFKFAIRFAARWAGRSWVANTSEKYLEKYIRKFAVRASSRHRASSTGRSSSAPIRSRLPATCSTRCPATGTSASRPSRPRTRSRPSAPRSAHPSPDRWASARRAGRAWCSSRRPWGSP